LRDIPVAYSSFRTAPVMGRVLCAAICGFLMAVVCAGMVLGQHDDAIPIVYAANRCLSGQVVHLDDGATACLVRFRE
jgi:hypothetical protein